ncbi:MAG: HDOD domain-containing protein [Lactobacillaceae bacterium]|jgi:HD superfamily phosphodiesterase|nr:HDOD domain-containing protein [Lactobacillaceae bacterium]
MPIGFPALSEAKQLLREAAAYKKETSGVDSRPYLEHAIKVADAAKKIAVQTLYLNPEKAYVLGLLHDYGHRILERALNKFHGQEGYEKMMEKGYFISARICLTHTFPNKDFDVKSTGYPEEWMLWAKQKLQDIEYDDYDRLIQLCDKFHDEGWKTSIENRVEAIAGRYNLPKERKSELLEEGQKLKRYFDGLCGKDLYELLGIKTEPAGYPTIWEAEKVFEDVISYRKEHFPHKPLTCSYINHSHNVAKAAKLIAESTAKLIPEKAYVLGLLHDCGKRLKEKESKKFHGREGYEYMLEKNYSDVARVCLTHTFPYKDARIDEMQYPNEWKAWAKEKLADVEYDDYDRLIQLCDKLCEEENIVRVEERMEKIVERYGLSSIEKERLLQEGNMLKEYFDKICGKDVYKILGVD